MAVTTGREHSSRSGSREEKTITGRATMDDARIKRLISFVEQNPDLWILDKKDYLMLKHRRCELWAEISAELDCTGNVD